LHEHEIHSKLKMSLY